MNNIKIYTKKRKPNKKKTYRLAIYLNQSLLNTKV